MLFGRFWSQAKSDAAIVGAAASATAAIGSSTDFPDPRPAALSLKIGVKNVHKGNRKPVASDRRALTCRKVRIHYNEPRPLAMKLGWVGHGCGEERAVGDSRAVQVVGRCAGGDQIGT